eukprot:g11202.t1
MVRFEGCRMRGFLMFCWFFDVLLFSAAKPPLEPEEIERLNKLFNLRKPELDLVAEREVEANFENQKKKLYTQRAPGQHAEAFLGESVVLESRDSSGKVVKKTVPMPRSKADVYDFLQAQEGPRDIFRSREDRAAADALTMCPEHAFLAEIPAETRKQWFGGFRLEFVEDADQEAVTASWSSGEPVFSMDDFPSIQLDLEASRKELLRDQGGVEAKVQLLCAAMGLSVSPGINDFSIKACVQAYLLFDPSLCVVDFVDDLRGTSRGAETSFRKVYLGMQKLRFFILRLGIVLHDFRPEKLDKMIFPTRAIDWIGFAVDSVAMTVSIDKERLVKTIASVDNYIRACQETHLTTAKELASIVGKLNFLVFIVRLGRRCLRTSCDALGASGAILVLQWTRGRKKFNPSIHVSKSMIEDWEWWIKVLRSDPRLPILLTDKGQAYLFTPELLDYPDVFKDMKASDVAIVTTDASRLGWGFSIDDDTSRGFAPWEFDGAKKSSNFRELFTVQKVLESGENFGGRRFLFLRADNTTARHYVNAGSGKYPDLAKIAGDIIQVCLSKGLVLIASHIAGKANVIADALSRLWLNSTITDANPNKRLNPRALNAVQKRMGLKITFDMLCSRGGVNSLTGNDYYDYRLNAFSVTAEETGEAFGHVLWWHPSLDMLQVTAKHLITFMTRAVDERVMALAEIAIQKARQKREEQILKKTKRKLKLAWAMHKARKNVFTEIRNNSASFDGADLADGDALAAGDDAIPIAENKQAAAPRTGTGGSANGNDGVLAPGAVLVRREEAVDEKDSKSNSRNAADGGHFQNNRDRGVAFDDYIGDAPPKIPKTTKIMKDAARKMEEILNRPASAGPGTSYWHNDEVMLSLKVKLKQRDLRKQKPDEVENADANRNHRARPWRWDDQRDEGK